LVDGFFNFKIIVKHYLSSETTVEAYWNNFAWPELGLFIGVTLASPYFKYCALVYKLFILNNP
jgi:hypothetical protein